MVGFAGVTPMETRDTTVRVVVPETVPLVAVMVLVPPATPVANPPVEIVAVAVVPDDQVTDELRSFVVLSLYVPVAVNCCVAPTVMEGFLGVTAMELSVAACFPPLHPAITRINTANNVIARARCELNTFMTPPQNGAREFWQRDTAGNEGSSHTAPG
jgi:hypothetical protein